ncbi:putative precorrin methyltransferase family protein [Lyophyllum shimeji]|uniref:precorrin-2 dehydrogenase n=1 Tax=Lyophyllum shimeji TaxID=47721 RepID=A0A9P3PYS9_LYOSH|nr:putative precorrin methyltransferase family protein [Lyophyllum shimeji]
MAEDGANTLAYPAPQGGASLVLAFRMQGNVTLVLGSGPLAASRAYSALEADSKVVILATGGLSAACDEIQRRAGHGQLTFVDWDTLPGPSKADGDEKLIEALESYLNSTPAVRLICMTDTLTGRPHSRGFAEKVYHLCRRRGLPINTTDMPDLCDFTFTSSHRFEAADGSKTPLQIGVTTNGQGCRLAGRIKRDIVSRLSKDVGAAVKNVGRMRALAKAKAPKRKEEIPEEEDDDELEENGRVLTPNRPVPSRSNSETEAESSRRRIKWVAQVSEYWPISKLAQMSESEMEEVLAGGSSPSPSPRIPHSDNTLPSIHSLTLTRSGRILLVGSGPGHPSLLTLATHTALTKMADLVLSDKLVPDAVLALIPKSVEVRIAKKFPGNAEGAQTEMMEAAVEAARRGLTVVRLKQGDPVVYGRAGEEVLYFRSQGFEPLVIPGVSSALAAPTFAGIPVTQRGVAESFMVCTGVGRRGKDVQLPGYERARTLIVLMGVARLPQVVQALTEEVQGGRREGAAYPLHTPIAIIERASMPDQRVVASTLKDVVRALENAGEQRPPGMIVIGWAVLALWGKGDVSVLEDGGETSDEERVRRWLAGKNNAAWRVCEGPDSGWEDF